LTFGFLLILNDVWWAKYPIEQFAKELQTLNAGRNMKICFVSAWNGKMAVGAIKAMGYSTHCA
jgi:hypothetical protein